MPDTNCIVVTASHEHAHHTRTIGELSRRIDVGERMFVAAPTLVEAYSVLTRIPQPYRLAAKDALAVIDEGFMRRGEIVQLSGAEYAELLRGLPRRGVVGGRVYDAVIAACAERAGIATFLTFNVPHFRALLPSTIEVLAPSTR